MSLPRLRLDGLSPRDLREALSTYGCFQLVDPRVSVDRARSVLGDARRFFALPPSAKAKLGIDRSRHFRGYSELRNERDWREQIHFGAETPEAGADPPYLQLAGPNLWPPDPTWRQQMTSYLGDVVSIGEEVLSIVARSLDLPADRFHALTHEPYVLMKLIYYHPQPQAGRTRPGVASHVDFSWVTLTLQDETGGLEMRRPDGKWIDVPPVPGTLLVHVGELLSFVTRDFYPATPHRVINPSSERPRVSIPIFLNANLNATIEPLGAWGERRAARARELSPDEHVHRFLPLDAAAQGFVYGEAEWRRKGLDEWCVECTGAIR